MGGLVFNQVRLVGFKSFVDPTDFVIEHGLTGIVGPNGCGKSNLLEAIRWVMGANSAKAMRAKGMEDVIFNGTKQRPGRNQAHVTLTIDNRARVAPPMFNDDDTLEVTRIINSGKGSTYKVNNKTVRAKDVQLLFADASTGANSPALVRQGQISELIAAKPSNRRRILEEAAGISGLHNRRHEAELRLRAAETNLDRLDDVIRQIESQLLSLRRQSRQAARYKRLAGEINEYKSLLWLKRWESALETLAASQEAFKVCEAQVQDTAARSSELGRLAAEKAETLDPKREEQIIAAAVLARLNAAKESLEQDEHAAKSEIRKLEQQLEQLATDIAREQGIVSDADMAIDRLSAEFDHLTSLADTTAALEDAAQTAEAAISARSELENAYNELTRQLADLNARRELAERELNQSETRLERLENEKQDAEEKLAGLSAGDNHNSANLFAASAREAIDLLETSRTKEQNLAEARQQAELADQSAREALSAAQSEVSKLEAEQSAIEKILRRNDGDDWTPALAKLDVQKGYEKALAAALGEDVDAPIGGGAAYKWTGANVPNSSLPNGAEPLSKFVSAPAELSARLSQIGVVPDSKISSLKSDLKPGQRLVSSSGHLMRWDGFEIQAEAETPAVIRLGQQNRLSDIEAEIKAKSGVFESARRASETARQSRRDADDAHRTARQAIPELERKERAAQASLTQYETDIARETAQKTALEDRIERLSMEIRDVTAQRASALEFKKGFKDTEQDEARKSELFGQLSAARAEADEASAAYRTLKNEADARKSRLEAVTNEKGAWETRGATAAERVKTLSGRREGTELALNSATDGPDQFEARRTKLFNELEAAESRRKSAADNLAEAETNLKSAESAARDAEAAHGQAREQRAAAEARATSAAERIEETKARIMETLNCEPGGLTEQLGDLSPESNLTESDIERKLERLQNERERMGGVNLRADVEAEEQEKRLVAMNDERADLIAAIARLREGIDELNSEGRKKLLAAFDTVNGHFSRLFTTLFGGGEASLALTESDDPLEAGLEIMVSPPGKKLGSMSLMSGGEQALTATALIFAVFLSNPAPICVLDEVDAPLDDANVSRYCNLLDEMTKQTSTKFIAITHNAVTMSRMNRLFGVTMAEQGVSQLVSMELESAAQLVAAE
ncbi:MAG: chromosome segregation protein SMC [Hellea sp.]|nr:chromosome segregation protein SMC [Hellea sp.]